MKSLLKYVGLAFILLGVAILVALHLLGFTAFVKKLLLIPFFMIVGGTVLYVWRLKRESKY